MHGEYQKSGSEPAMVRAPNRTSEPEHQRVPFTGSEPHCVRAPNSASEPCMGEHRK